MLPSPATRFLAAAALLACLAPAGVPAARPAQTPAPAVNRDAQLAAEFTRRVQQYVEIHVKADSSLAEFPKSATKEQVDAHQRSLSQLIGRARANARQGDIFSADIRAYFRRQIHRAVAGPGGAALKAAIMEENPVGVRLMINGRYPDMVPFTTMPPQILAALPRLPKEVEYRFIGRRLVLLDVHGQLVVDYIDDAIPR